MTLFRLAYISTSLLASNPREREHIADLLLTSRRNNEGAEITGALLATDNSFAQVLEGARGAVEATYRRILRDPGHTGILPLLTDSIMLRQFPEWSTAYIGPSQSADEAVARVTRQLASSNAGQVARSLVTFMSQMLADQSTAVRPARL